MMGHDACLSPLNRMLPLGEQVMQRHQVTCGRPATGLSSRGPQLSWAPLLPSIKVETLIPVVCRFVERMTLQQGGEAGGKSLTGKFQAALPASH